MIVMLALPGVDVLVAVGGSGVLVAVLVGVGVKVAVVVGVGGSTGAKIA